MRLRQGYGARCKKIFIMELFLALPFLLIPLVFPFIAGVMAQDSGRSFRLWFWLAIPFPVITHIILLCLPDKTKKPVYAAVVVENDEVFDHLFIEESKEVVSNCA
jgi:MFS family permease